MRRQASNSAPRRISLDWTDHGCIQIRSPLISNPGVTSRTEKRVTRRSKGARLFRFLRVTTLVTPGLEPIFFHPPIESAAAQPQCICGLADIALKPLQRLADQNTFNGFQTQFFEVLGLRFLRIES